MDRVKELNLAAWKYRNILDCKDSPIKKISISKREIAPNKMGYEALAYLNVPFFEKNIIYGTAAGTGSSIYRYEACQTAISEALERWAFIDTYKSQNASQYFFDVDPSTSGMAAFPGLTKHSVRGIALSEAIERWSVCAWWEEKLQTKSLHVLDPTMMVTKPLALNSIDSKNILENITPHNVGILEIDSPWVEYSITIVFTKSKTTNTYAYGFASCNSYEKSYKKALIELWRNIYVLDLFFTKEASSLNKVQTAQEKRLLYFASNNGFKKFISYINRSHNNMSKPALLLDTEIKGAWSKYATVWRCLFDPSLLNHTASGEDYFMF